MAHQGALQLVDVAGRLLHDLRLKSQQRRLNAVVDATHLCQPEAVVQLEALLSYLRNVVVHPVVEAGDQTLQLLQVGLDPLLLTARRHHYQRC